MSTPRNRLVAFTLALFPLALCTAAIAEVQPTEKTDDLVIAAASVTYLEDLELLVFEQRLQGKAGNTVPTARGQLHEAPVLAYVFPTTLDSSDVGFGDAEGIVALAVTSHPDFDDTPLWDEDGNRDYEDDGRIFHSHWVLLAEDERVPGGLAVVEFEKTDGSVTMPPTGAGMPMYLDSPGFAIVERGATLKVLVPVSRVSGAKDFNFDAVSAYLEVNTEDPSRPLLGVYAVYSVLSGDLSLPFAVK